MLISIVVPVYKVEKYIHRCIESILSQAFTDFRLVLVDDGSTDNCGEICDGYVIKDNRVVVVHKKNGGLSDARNAGIELEISCNECKYISFVDSDDWISTHYLEFLCQSIKTENADVSCCKHIECENEYNNTSERVADFSCFDGENFCVKEYKYSQTAWGKLFNLEQWINLRFPVGKIHEDAFSIYKILLPAKKIAFVSNPPLYFFNSINNDSITRKVWSPKRMDLLCAFDEKLEYSKINGYDQYYLIQIREYINTLVFNYHNAVADSSSESVRYIRKKTRKALKKSVVRKMFPFLSNLWIYEIAYPNLMKQYWRIKSIKSKIKRNSH